ncbi:MAG: aminotransferase class I/II-fold pyridoxal phosphate-dependent enzyme [Cyanobacteria bacterium]|nr:aminotransferase class I/II-fold pyridoxal phosphate-dependent enzyme [Cyanobacteriota bacterium]MDA1020229.1 aminotransferase class I/II-fold pyridoxal phosphate-dependent enzyme [Cyanobacteriota bacterium]
MKSPYNKILPSLRLVEMPSYAFGQLDATKEKLLKEGKEIIDLSLGSPDRETDPRVLQALTDGMAKPRNQKYPIFTGLPAFKKKCAAHFKHRFGVDIDPETGILPLNGSKEGIAHIAFAYMQEGLLTIIPSPYYPVHMRGTVLAGGHVHELPLNAENNFVADLDAIPEDILLRARMMILSHPNNPTGSVVDKAYLEKAVAICKDYNILLINDLAYADIWFDEPGDKPGDRPKNKPHSILEVRGGADIAIEFHTFSKVYNMAGMRLGYAVGNTDIINTLYKLKTNIDYGVCMGIQEAGMAAIDLGDEYREEVRLEYQNRRDFIYQALCDMGVKVNKPGGAMYFWMPIPKSYIDQNKNSFDFAADLLAETGVALVPGLTFGKFGEDYVRIAMVQPMDKIKIAMERLAGFLSSTKVKS